MSAFHRLHALRMENDAAGFAMEELRPRFDRLAHRHQNGTAPRAVVVYQLFQTPPIIAQQLAELLNLKPGARILEPSAGLGRLLDAVKPFNPSEVVAIEQAADCAAELFRQDRDRVTIKQRDFLAIQPEEIGLFDAVIMNPPFHMRADIRHIEHALKFLHPNGRLAAICLNGPARRQRFQSETWIDLPAKCFKGEGTLINAAMIAINA